MIQSIQSFISYFEGIRRRTLNYIRTIPPDQLDWKPRDGEFTIRDLVLHLAATEKLFVGVFVDGKWLYDKSHEAYHQATLDELITYLDQAHQEAMTRLSIVSDSELMQPRPTLDGPTLKAWRLLMMLTEHEIHHRSQLAMYLFLIGIQPPHIYGLGLEDVIARATG